MNQCNRTAFDKAMNKLYCNISCPGSCNQIKENYTPPLGTYVGREIVNPGGSVEYTNDKSNICTIEGNNILNCNNKKGIEIGIKHKSDAKIVGNRNKNPSFYCPTKWNSPRNGKYNCLECCRRAQNQFGPFVCEPNVLPIFCALNVGDGNNPVIRTRGVTRDDWSPFS